DHRREARVGRCSCVATLHLSDAGAIRGGARYQRSYPPQLGAGQGKAGRAGARLAAHRGASPANRARERRLGRVSVGPAFGRSAIIACSKIGDAGKLTLVAPLRSLLRRTRTRRHTELDEALALERAGGGVVGVVGVAGGFGVFGADGGAGF